MDANTDANTDAVTDAVTDQVTGVEGVDSQVHPTGLRAVQGALPEALGYLGGLLILGGSVSFLSRVWDSVPLGGRVGIAAAAAVVLAFAGWLLDERAISALRRLRAVLWTASTIATGIAVGLAAAQGLQNPPARTVVMLVALSVGLQSGLMWAGRDRPVNLAVHLVAWPVAIGAISAHLVSTTWQGLAIWTVGAIGIWLGLFRVRRWSVLWALIGGGSALVGAAFVASRSEGIALGIALGTALGLLALGMIRGVVDEPGPRIGISILGAIATLQLAPTSIGYFSDQSGVLTGVVVWVVGGAIFLAAVGQLLWVPRLCEVIGAAVMVIGAAVIATQVTALALGLGLVTSLILIGVGTRPERTSSSLVGAGGLLIFVPWTLSHFFPGEGRVPVLITVTGIVILAVAIHLLRRRA